MKIRKISRSDIPPKINDNYKGLLNAITNIGGFDTLEITLPKKQNARNLKIYIYRMAKRIGLKISITERITDNKSKFYIYQKE